MKNTFLKGVILLGSFVVGITSVIAIDLLKNKAEPAGSVEEGQVLSLSTTKRELKKEVYLVTSLKQPDAYQIELQYNPLSIEVESIETGNIWKKTNVLTSKIDNKKGILKYAAGESFNSTFTGDNRLFTINFKGKNDDNYDFTVNPQSRIGYVGKSILTFINQTSLNFVLK